VQDQAQICTTHSAFEVFNCKSTAIERQGDCGAVTAASEHISAAALENTAELVTSKSTSRRTTAMRMTCSSNKMDHTDLNRASVRYADGSKAPKMA